VGEGPSRRTGETAAAAQALEAIRSERAASSNAVAEAMASQESNADVSQRAEAAR
jgi:hypothetical protein